MPRKQKKHKKPRFYADENIFPASIIFLRSKKINIIHAVEDKGFTTRDDQFHATWAQQNKRVLLTLDTDFLNNRWFPLRKNWGIIIVIVPAPVTSSKVNKILAKLLPLFKQSGRDYFRFKKLKITPDTLTIWNSDKSGKITYKTSSL